MPEQIVQKQKQKNCEFIDKLLDMMQKNPKDIHWTKDGNELIISNYEELETKILPEYFRHRNLASFVRQLNMYGFCKKEKREKFLRFSHKIFKKNNSANYHLIQRKAKCGTNRCSSSKFAQSNSKLMETIKTKSGLNDSAQELTLSLLQYKDNIQEVLRKIRSHLDKLMTEFKDTRSKDVLETLSSIQKECYPSLMRSLAKGKAIDGLMHEINSIGFDGAVGRDRRDRGDQEVGKQDDGEQCSLENQLEDEESEKCNSENQISQRFEMDEEELSAFNQFQLREDK